MLNPTYGTKTINVDFAASTLALGGSITYTNVNQTTPVLASNTATGSGTNPSVSLTASGPTTKVLFGHVGTYRTSSGYTVTDGQTQRWSQTGQAYKGFGSDKSVTNGSVSTSWTSTQTASWVAIAVLLQPTRVGTAFTCSAEFLGTSNTNNWNHLIWTLNAASTTDGANIAYQLYNYQTGQYAASGDGYLTDILSTTDQTKTQTINNNPTNFRDASGNWKIKVTATLAASFDLKFDYINYRVNQNNYALNLEEEWLTVNASNVRQDLCIKTGDLASESLVVQVLVAGYGGI